LIVLLFDPAKQLQKADGGGIVLPVRQFSTASCNEISE
jgi:hypothetical protein